MTWLNYHGCACSSPDCIQRGCRLMREGKVATPHPMPRGCICPPGANRDCESPSCPRKPHTPLQPMEQIR
jgi:hypothetical protein